MNVCESNIFSKSTKEVPSHMKTYEEIPVETIKQIIEEIQKVVIYSVSTKEFICPRCSKILDENKYCSNCLISYSESYNKYVLFCDSPDIYNGFKYDYYNFEISNGEVLLYKIVYSSSYDIYDKEHYKISLNSVYWIKEDCIIELLTNRTFIYKDILDIIENETFDSFKENVDDIENIFKEYDISFIDTNSLDLLRNNKVYKKSHIWDLKDYFKKNDFRIFALTVYPVYVKQFEYLVKMGLYNLACINPKVVDYKGNFYDNFKVDKKHYSYMKNIDITPKMLKTFRIVPILDEKWLKELSETYNMVKRIAEDVNIGQAIEYIKKYNIDIEEYVMYLNMLIKLKVDLNDKQYVFPNNFSKKFLEIIIKSEELKNSKLNKEIKENAVKYGINRYEDDKYVIFPAPNLESIYIESYNQHNYIKIYSEFYAANICQIYFMRYKDKLNDSLVTIIVEQGTIKQARCKYNKEPDGELLLVLKRWEKTLVPGVRMCNINYDIWCIKYTKHIEENNILTNFKGVIYKDAMDKYLRNVRNQMSNELWKKYVEVMREHNCDEVVIEILSNIYFISGRGQAVSECLFALDENNYYSDVE